MSASHTDIEEWLQEGLRHYAMSDPSRALEAWYRVLDVEPKNSRALEYIDYVRKNFRVEVKHPALEPIEGNGTRPEAPPASAQSGDVLPPPSAVPRGQADDERPSTESDVPAPPSLEAEGPLPPPDVDADVPAPPPSDPGDVLAPPDGAPVADTLPEPLPQPESDDLTESGADEPEPVAVDAPEEASPEANDPTLDEQANQADGRDEQDEAPKAPPEQPAAEPPASQAPEAAPAAAHATSWGALVGAALGQPAEFDAVPTTPPGEPAREPTVAAHPAEAPAEQPVTPVNEAGDIAAHAQKVLDEATVDDLVDTTSAEPISEPEQLPADALTPADDPTPKTPVGPAAAPAHEGAAEAMGPVKVAERPAVVRYATYDDEPEEERPEPARLVNKPVKSLRFDTYGDDAPADDAPAHGAAVDDAPPEPDTAPDTAAPAAQVEEPAMPAPVEEPAADTVPSGPAPALSAQKAPTVPAPATPESAEAAGGDVFEIWSAKDDSAVDLDENPVGPSIFDELLGTSPSQEGAPMEAAVPLSEDEGPFGENIPTSGLTESRGPQDETVQDAPSLAPSEAAAKATAPPEVDRTPADECASLMDGARELFALGDFSGSLELVEKVLKLDENNAAARAYLSKNEETLLKMYESKLGDLEGAPYLITQPDEVVWMNLHHRAGFLLAQVDGVLSYEDLAAVSGMSRLETFRILADLVQNGVIKT